MGHIIASLAIYVWVDVMLLRSACMCRPQAIAGGYPASTEETDDSTSTIENRERRESEGRRRMADWGPVVIAVVLFVLLTPGLLFQLPGNSRAIEFANLQTSGVSIFVHTILFFGLITIFLIAIGVHITTG
ncbi:hypothetical protein M9H77_37092 [Catharanthus roseus]|uniref:Uncharacterized protein n=1 Tax=Catharanthus roseus TaxID=4058 RepID=A0ACB9ZVV1_CATRO|nr:hypothetical protein M9H77_37092 [Catharanthus roseus]